MEIFLYATNPYLGIFLFAILFVTCQAKRLMNLVFACIFMNGALNALLKSIFMVPLHKSLNNPCWWALPSGHMQYGIVFWGILWINTKYNIKFLLAAVICLLASGTVMSLKNYHTPLDMICALPPAALILFGYDFALTRIDLKKSKLLYLNIFSMAWQGLVLYVVDSPCANYKFNWIWLNIGANVAFMLISFRVKDSEQQLLSKMQLYKRPLALIIFVIVLESLSFYKIIIFCTTAVTNSLAGMLFTFLLLLNSILYDRLKKTNG